MKYSNDNSNIPQYTDMPASSEACTHCCFRVNQCIRLVGKGLQVTGGVSNGETNCTDTLTHSLYEDTQQNTHDWLLAGKCHQDALAWLCTKDSFFSQAAGLVQIT